MVLSLPVFRIFIVGALCINLSSIVFSATTAIVGAQPDPMKGRYNIYLGGGRYKYNDTWLGYKFNKKFLFSQSSGQKMERQKNIVDKLAKKLSTATSKLSAKQHDLSMAEISVEELMAKKATLETKIKEQSAQTGTFNNMKLSLNKRSLNSTNSELASKNKFIARAKLDIKKLESEVKAAKSGYESANQELRRQIDVDKESTFADITNATKVISKTEQ